MTLRWLWASLGWCSLWDGFGLCWACFEMALALVGWIESGFGMSLGFAGLGLALGGFGSSWARNDLRLCWNQSGFGLCWAGAALGPCWIRLAWGWLWRLQGCAGGWVRRGQLDGGGQEPGAVPGRDSIRAFGKGSFNDTTTTTKEERGERKKRLLQGPLPRRPQGSLNQSCSFHSRLSAKEGIMAGDKRRHVALCSQGPASAVTSLQLIFPLVSSCNYTFRSQAKKKKKSRTSCAPFALGTLPGGQPAISFSPFFPGCRAPPRFLRSYENVTCSGLINSSRLLSSHQSASSSKESLFQGSCVLFSCLFVEGRCFLVDPRVWLTKCWKWICLDWVSFPSLSAVPTSPVSPVVVTNANLRVVLQHSGCALDTVPLRS